MVGLSACGGGGGSRGGGVGSCALSAISIYTCCAASGHHAPVRCPDAKLTLYISWGAIITRTLIQQPSNDTSTALREMPGVFPLVPVRELARRKWLFCSYQGVPIGLMFQAPAFFMRGNTRRKVTRRNMSGSGCLTRSNENRK